MSHWRFFHSVTCIVADSKSGMTEKPWVQKLNHKPTASKQTHFLTLESAGVGLQPREAFWSFSIRSHDHQGFKSEKVVRFPSSSIVRALCWHAVDIWLSSGKATLFFSASVNYNEVYLLLFEDSITTLLDKQFVLYYECLSNKWCPLF